MNAAGTIAVVHIRKQIEVARPVDEVFRYVADFSNSSEWDPGIAESRALTDGPVRKGARRVAEPFLRGTMERMGDDALSGLKSVLGRNA